MANNPEIPEGPVPMDFVPGNIATSMRCDRIPEGAVAVLKNPRHRKNAANKGGEFWCRVVDKQQSTTQLADGNHVATTEFTAIFADGSQKGRNHERSSQWLVLCDGIAAAPTS